MNATIQEVGERIGRAIARDAIAHARVDPSESMEWEGIAPQDSDAIPDELLDCVAEIEEVACETYYKLIRA